MSPRSSSLQQPNHFNSAVITGGQDDRYAAVRVKPFVINESVLQSNPVSSLKNGIGSHGQYQFHQKVLSTDEKVNQSWVVLQASSINQESIREQYPVRSQLGADRSPMKLRNQAPPIQSPTAAVEGQSPQHKNMFMGNLNVMEPGSGVSKFGRANNNLPSLSSPVKVPYGAKPALGSSLAAPREFQSGN